MINHDTKTGDLSFDMKIPGTTLHRKAFRVEIDPDNFLKIVETLTRIGIYSPSNKTLWQSCHILHKKGFYYIVHFKELFGMDGKEVSWNIDDSDRFWTIVGLLLKWKLIRLPDGKEFPLMHYVENEKFLVKLRIIPFKSKRDFNLCSKYTIGEK